MLRRRAGLALGGSAAALALLVTGCSATGEPASSGTAAEEGSASPSASKASPSSSSSPSEPLSSSPSESATSSPTATTSSTPGETPSATVTGSASPSPSVTDVARPVGRVRPADRLLRAEEVPGFNEQFRWRAAGTRKSEGAEPFGTCHRFAMTSIGAMRVAVREYTPVEGPASDTAGHLVAEFADEKTARRAFAVLKSWRGQCRELLGEYDRAKVGALEAVAVGGGQGGWYLLTYGPAEGGPAGNGSGDAGAGADAGADGGADGYFDAQGLARVGTRIAVLEMRLRGQDYNYPAGREPMLQAVRAAAARLGQ